MSQERTMTCDLEYADIITATLTARKSNAQARDRAKYLEAMLDATRFEMEQLKAEDIERHKLEDRHQTTLRRQVSEKAEELRKIRAENGKLRKRNRDLTRELKDALDKLASVQVHLCGICMERPKDMD